MSGENIQIEGLKPLARAFRKTHEDLLKMLKAINREAAAAIAADAVSRAPRRTGRLASSIRPTGTAYAGIVRAGNNTTVPYAGPIHFGWTAHNISPNPFLYDALDARRGEVEVRYRAQLDAIIAKSGSKP